MTFVFSRLKLSFLPVLFAVFLVSPALADNPLPFDLWLKNLKTEAKASGISDATLQDALTGLEPDAKVIELDRKQPESTISFKEYLIGRANKRRIENGRAMLNKHRDILVEVGHKYGVPPRFIVALWGLETNYGGYTGGKSVIRSLATLAHDGRRSEFFKKELLTALEILDRGHFKSSEMQGSWAGAMGQSQFMPSSYVDFAVDHDKDGFADIWKSEADVFASAANYLVEAGWKTGETWGRKVQLPKDFDASHAGLETQKTLAQWQSLGVRRDNGAPLPLADLSGSVILPDGPDGDAYLVYENFRVIMRWNRSTYFATTIGVLADRIGMSGQG